MLRQQHNIQHRLIDSYNKSISSLYVACKEHNLAYENTTDVTTRHKADKILEETEALQMEA